MIVKWIMFLYGRNHVNPKSLKLCQSLLSNFDVHEWIYVSSEEEQVESYHKGHRLIPLTKRIIK